MAVKIFLVDPDVAFARLSAKELEKQGWGVCAFFSTRFVWERAMLEPPVLFLLNLVGLGKDGVRLFHRLRQNGGVAKAPIVLLDDRLPKIARKTPELRPDGYITKPISFHELVARVKEFIGDGEECDSRVTKIGRLEIDSDSMTVSSNGKKIPLTTTEFRILEHLARHRGRAFSRKEILRRLWRGGRLVSPRSVDSHIWRLREKLETVPGNAAYLHTVHGFGYFLAMPDEASAA